MAKKPVVSKGGEKPAPTKKQLAQLASEIHKLDQEILKLINKRADASIRLIQADETPHKAIFDPAADERLAEFINNSNPGPLSANTVRGIYREILSGARGAVKHRRVAYLGPSYTFSHLAALERFGSTAELIPVSTIASVFEEVNRGAADFGVVPIENSTDGRIVDTLDMFTRLPLKICAEVQLIINHHLLAKCPRGEIVEIYSKPQALSQCRDWLTKNMPQARLVEVTSTSTAAQLARDKHGAAAVASRQAAQIYDLQVVAENIQDNKHNITRFAVIGHDSTKPTGKDKTAVLVQIHHKPGALADALSAFKANKVNLTWIESFPLKGPEVGYLFFLDFEGHSSEPKVKRALAELGRIAVRIEELGSYSRSEPIG